MAAITVDHDDQAARIEAGELDELTFRGALVDGLATWTPSADPRAYEPRARSLVADGYLTPVEYERYLTDAGS